WIPAGSMASFTPPLSQFVGRRRPSRRLFRGGRDVGRTQAPADAVLGRGIMEKGPGVNSKISRGPDPPRESTNRFSSASLRLAAPPPRMRQRLLPAMMERVLRPGPPDSTSAGTSGVGRMAPGPAVEGDFVGDVEPLALIPAGHGAAAISRP